MQQTQSPKAGERTQEVIGKHRDGTTCYHADRCHLVERTQHTPGPWRIEGDLDTLCVVAGDYSLIGEIHTEDINPPRYEEAEANGRLIAAAPELLEALKQSDKWIKSFAQDHPDIYEASVRNTAAIAKTEGRAL